MTISLGQILVVLIIGLIMFGNFPNILRDLSKGLKNVMKPGEESNSDLSNKEVNKQEKRDSNP
jgi:Sec-independent protein translocase protein TatA